MSIYQIAQPQIDSDKFLRVMNAMSTLIKVLLIFFGNLSNQSKLSEQLEMFQIFSN